MSQPSKQHARGILLRKNLLLHRDSKMSVHLFDLDQNRFRPVFVQNGNNREIDGRGLRRHTQRKIALGEGFPTLESPLEIRLNRAIVKAKHVTGPKSHDLTRADLKQHLARQIDIGQAAVRLEHQHGIREVIKYAKTELCGIPLRHVKVTAIWGPESRQAQSTAPRGLDLGLKAPDTHHNGAILEQKKAPSWGGDGLGEAKPGSAPAPPFDEGRPEGFAQIQSPKTDLDGQPFRQGLKESPPKALDQALQGLRAKKNSFH